MDHLYPLDHIGIAVENLEISLLHYQEKFGFEIETREVLEHAGVEVAFINTGNNYLELITPLAQSPSTALTKFLKEKGPGLHHLCYTVTNINTELLRLKTLGLKLVDSTPHKGARRTLVAFIHPKSMQGILTELCQYIVD